MICSKISTTSVSRTFQGLGTSWRSITAFRKMTSTVPLPTSGPSPSNTWHDSSMSGTGRRNHGTTMRRTWLSAPSLRPLLPHPQGVVRHAGVLVPRQARAPGDLPPPACAPCRRVRAPQCVGTAHSPRGVVHLPLGRVPHRGLLRATPKAPPLPGAPCEPHRAMPRREARRRATSDRPPLDGVALLRGVALQGLVPTPGNSFPWKRKRSSHAGITGSGSANLAPNAITSTSTPRPRRPAVAASSVLRRLPLQVLRRPLRPRPCWSIILVTWRHPPKPGLAPLLSNGPYPL